MHKFHFHSKLKNLVKSWLGIVLIHVSHFVDINEKYWPPPNGPTPALVKISSPSLRRSTYFRLLFFVLKHFGLGSHLISKLARDWFAAVISTWVTRKGFPKSS